MYRFCDKRDTEVEYSCYIYFMKIPCIFTFFFFAAVNSFAQGTPAGDTLLTGTWKGTSICQVKPSACNDEIAVYHISATKKPAQYHVIANKVINGKEEDMAVEDFNWDAKNNTLYCYDAKYDVEIELTVIGSSIKGQLLQRNIVHRIITLEKTYP